MTEAKRTLLDLDWPGSWPAARVDALENHYNALRSREIGPLSDDFDAAIYALVGALEPYSIVGWHCTRLAGA